jgi:hypothetical protein
MGFWKNITTGKDNQTHDIVRVCMVSVTVTLLVTLILGAAMYLYGYVASLSNPMIKPFDIQTFFNATSTQGAAIGAFLMSGAASLFFKKTTEPDGTVTETEQVTKGKQPDQTTIVETNL